MTQIVVAESWESIRATERLIEAVQDRLRARYPLTVVRLRDPHAEVGSSGVPTLYVFRDGRAA